MQETKADFNGAMPYIEPLLYIGSECARMHLWHLNMEKQPQFRERNEGY